MSILESIFKKFSKPEPPEPPKVGIQPNPIHINRPFRTNVKAAALVKRAEGLVRRLQDMGRRDPTPYKQRLAEVHSELLEMEIEHDITDADSLEQLHIRLLGEH